MTAKQKPIPPNTLDNTIPPNKSYVYFEDCNDHPFRHASNIFEMINAWWLAEAAFLAYAEPPFAKPRFQDAGLPEVEFFSGESTQCYVARNDNFVIVAFRGSELREREGTNSHDIRYIVADWRIDLMTDLVRSGQGGSVHKGFKEALDEVWTHKRLKPYLDEASNRDGRKRSVWFTGHSLGAALATLAAAQYDDVAGLYAFGSPRVGDRAFANCFRVNSYRFVNNDDVVTKVPLLSYHRDGIFAELLSFGLYRHVGNLKYIDSEGNILDAPSLWMRLKDNFRKVVKNAFNLGLLRIRGELPRNSLTDHAPIYYALSIWNNYDRARQG
jgi:triacylglycerol lipase